MAVANNNLAGAKLAKNDEFYTRYADIEKEMNAYLDYDANVFRDKTVLLPCDDPEWSDFTKYFAQNFHKLGLRKLISTSYAPDSRPINMLKQPTLFESESPKFDEGKTRANGKIFTLHRDNTGDGRIDVNDLEWDYLQGDGDFRSEEVTALRDEADVVITNPPFSLFREFLGWVVEGGKSFVLVGNMNAITYKELFPLIMKDRVWIGATHFNTGMYFYVPDDFKYAVTYKFDKEIDGKKVSRVPGVCWFTNIDHGRRHQPLSLMTEADNRKFSKHKDVKGIGYRKYDNYDAIEVPYTDAIPSDYQGVMGVPITFLDKYSPEQFEVVGITKTWFGGASKTYPKQTQVSANGTTSTVTKLNDGPAIKVSVAPTNANYYKVGKDIYVQAYARILIRQRQETE
jgi:hypothetical protein